MEPSPDAHSFTHRRRSRTRGPWEDHASGQDQRHLCGRPRTWADHSVDRRQPHPSSTITRICGPLLTRFNLKIEVPGILFIDTPGHETFSNLRKRGGSAADVAVLVIDLTKGIEPQTVESLNILKARKTPFLVCCNKIDAIPG